MNSHLLRQHLFRAWKKHWPLQFASVSVMTLVLVILNLMFLGFSSFNQLVTQWGRGMEMAIYLKESTQAEQMETLRDHIEKSGDFDEVKYTSKAEATKRFLQALGPESTELLNDPKWNSPIPASFELKLSDKIQVQDRLSSLQGWGAQFKAFDFVDDVFYGQGWVENFSKFLRSARGLVALLWALSLSVGLLIVSNCIRLSFLQRREEIEVLELVGATPRFIRTPFMIEGLALGLMASGLSLALSYGAHTILLAYLSHKWNFWMSIQEIAPMQPWYIFANVFSGVAFGVLGAWNCVRKLNTGWSAAVS